MEDKKKFSVIQDYLTVFVSNIRENDPLPVRAPTYEVSESEIDGQILDIVYHYLNQRDCHPYIRYLVAHRVWNKMRNADSDEIDGLMHTKQPYYDSIKLIKDVTNAANSTIKDILSTLSPSVTDTLPQYMQISHYCIKNARRKMEDRCTILQDLNTLYGMEFGYPHAYYGVFDGHCGADGAVYTAAHLHQFLIQNPLYSTNLEAALKHAFHICDTNFIRHARTERLKGGTTAVVALVRENRLVVAWLGDSQALLVRKRKAAHVGEPHSPSRECERKRIDDMGGAVLEVGGTWRVLGQLAVSRAIGDADYKPYISSECDIKSLEICGDEDFLILACDGLWDTLSPKEAVNLVYAYLTQNDGDTDGVGKCLVEAARLAGSNDNITAVVVFLRPVLTLMEEEAIRVEKGEVTDVGQVIPISKDSQPNFITNLFSQPPIPFKDVAKAENHYTANNQLGTDIPPFEEPAPDYDMDNVSENILPTDEEVDAVLAELDSIPDAPEDIEDSSDDEQWTYAKIEPRMLQAQTDDILPDAVFGKNIIAESHVDSPMMFENDLLTDEFQKSNSLKSVEGFVTSVELNASQETFITDLNVNQDPQLSLDNIEQTTRPFSIYVSSSPEPASMEAIVQSQSSITSLDQDIVNIPEKISDTSKDLSSVEIIHAQSTIEVTPNSLKEEESIPITIPDIMTQSFTGELPVAPRNLLDINNSLFDESFKKLENNILNENVISQIQHEIIEPEQKYFPVEQINIESDNIAEKVALEYESPNNEEQTDNLSMIKQAPLLDDLVETSPSAPAVDVVEGTHPKVMHNLLKDEFNILENPSMMYNYTTEDQADRVDESDITLEYNLSDVKQINEDSKPLIIESNLLNRKEQYDIGSSESGNVVVENEGRHDEIILQKTKLQEADAGQIKVATETKEVSTTINKRIASSVQHKKTIKDLPKPLPRVLSKTERITLKKSLPTREPTKPLIKKDPAKKTASTRIISKSTTPRTTTILSLSKSTVTTAKSTATPRLASKSPASKLPERPLQSSSSRPASSITKKPISNLASKSKNVTKTPEKVPITTKAANVVPARRPQTTRPTIGPTARANAMTTTRSAAFAPPTKDSKNTANKLLSSKSTNNTISNSTKVPTKITPKQMATNKLTAGMKTKANSKPPSKVKGKEDLVTNGTSKNCEKESCVEKIENVDQKKKIINGDV